MRLTFARCNRPFSSADGKFVERKLSENTANKLHFVSREDTLYQIKGEENYELIHTLRGKLMRDRGMSVEQAFVEMDRIIELYRNGDASKLEELAPLAPKYAHFFTPLPLTNAFIWYNNRHNFAKRRHVAPSDDELRHVFNVSQLMTLSPGLKLLSFDGDKTLYDNRSAMQADSPLVPQLVRLLNRGITVALTTAVGAADPSAYEERLRGLLDALASDGVNLTEEGLQKRGQVLVMGGQCNYLFRLDPSTNSLHPVEEDEWKTEDMMSWDKEAADDMLTAAFEALKRVSADFRLPLRYIKKPFAVGGLFCGEMDGMTSLHLDEVALEVREQLNARNYPVPFCCFNGGLDVFIDLGSKQHGITALQKLLGVKAHETLHVGDQFTRTGNDLLARRVCPTCWVTSPLDTHLHLKWFLGFLDKHDRHIADRTGAKA